VSLASLARAAPLPRADCWNHIGVQGDRSCPELREHIHCRNCPVYAAAARSVLERELPDGYAHGWQERFAQGELEAATQHPSWFIFRLGSEWLAVPTAAVDEVARVSPVHSLPHRRGGAVVGLVNVRGELVVCASLVHVLGTEAGTDEAAARPARARLLVLERGGARFAAPVDEVHGAERVPERLLVAPPATVGNASGIFTRHVLPWNARSVGCLDADALFHALERSCT
jgi:chemotaxis-related protein WspD